MSIYRKFKTDPKVEQDGIWLDYGDGARMRIARAGGSNKAFLKAMERLHRKYKREIQLDILEEDVAYPALVEVYATTIALEWEGFTDEDGNPLVFSKENIVKVFTDLPELFRDVRRMADNFTLYRAYLDEEAAKN